MAGRKSVNTSMTGGAADGMSRESGPKRKRGMCVVQDRKEYHPPTLPDLPEGATHEHITDQMHRRVKTKYERSFP